MKASETKFSRIIEGTNQYMVPHYQRPYTWGSLGLYCEDSYVGFANVLVTKA